MTRDIGFTAAAGDSGSELALKPYRRDICATYVMLTLTTAALVLAFRQLGGSLVHELAAHQWSIAIGQLAFMLVVALLLWGNFVYQLRSEERRVGKGCRYLWWWDHVKKV